MTIEDVREQIEFLLRANDARIHYSKTDREFGVCNGVAITCNKLLHFLAQGTEAQRAETVKQGSVHDGPVAKPCAQPPSSSHPSKE